MRRSKQRFSQRALDATLRRITDVVQQRATWASLQARRTPAPRRPITQAIRLIAGLAVLVVIGTLLFLLPISSTRPLTIDEALFTAVSALCTTGLSVITPSIDLTLFGQIVLLGLMQIGGIGFMAGAVVLFRVMGRRITLEERLALRDSMGLISTGSLLRLTRSVLVGVLIIEAVGACILWALWFPTFGPGRAAYYAVWHSVSAFTNSSFDLFSGAPDAPAGFPTDAATLLTISGLIILGSIGIPVIADIVLWPYRRRISLHTKLTIVTAITLVIVGTLGVFLSESKPGVLFADLPWPRRLLLAFFHSVSSRTSGFVLQPLATMDPSSTFLLTVLMFIGGSPASMGGGITTSTLAILVLAMYAYLRGKRAIVVSQRTISSDTVLKAVAILTISMALVGVVSWLILLTHNTNLSEATFEVVSAFATCGFTLGLTPELNVFGRLLIALTMFWGRLGALTLVAALTGHAESSRMVEYPEEQILIG